MSIAEPMTLLTDWALALFSGLLAVRLLSQARASPVRLWGWAFAASALAAFLGGAYHGFAPMVGELGLVLLWKATVFSLGFTSFLLLAATVLATVSQRLRPWLLGAVALKLGVYLLWMAGHDEFKYVVYDYASGLLAILALQAAAALAAPTPSSPWIIGGVLVSFVAAGLQQSGFRLHPHFNHNDLYHVVQMAAVWLLYRGGRALGGTPGER